MAAKFIKCIEASRKFHRPAAKDRDPDELKSLTFSSSYQSFCVNEPPFLCFAHLSNAVVLKVVPRSAATSPEEWLEIQFLGSRPTQKLLRVGPRNLVEKALEVR